MTSTKTTTETKEPGKPTVESTETKDDTGTKTVKITPAETEKKTTTTTETNKKR